MKRILLVALLVLASTAHADEDARSTYRAVVDQVELEPAAITGYRLRVYLSALALGGQLLDLTDPKAIKLFVGASELKVPYALGSYAATSSETAIVFVVQNTGDFADVLPMIGDALDHELIATIGERAQLAVLTYGDVPGTGKLAPVKAIRGKGAPLASDGSAGDPALLDTIDRALALLRKASVSQSETGVAEQRPLRKMIVVIGDGRDRSGDKDRVTRAGTRAAREGVRIHAIGFSQADARRPMLALGELSKRSLGTFRWVRKPTADSWVAALHQLRDEIDHQYVLTYFVSADDDVAGKKLHVVTVGRTEAVSNELRVPTEPRCGGDPCTAGYCAAGRCVASKEGGGRSALGWVVLVGGGIVGTAFVLGLIGFMLTKRQERAAHVAHVRSLGAGAPAIAAPPVAAKAAKPPKTKRGKQAVVATPGMLPNGRPIPALLVMSGPRSGERLLLRDGFAIGKQPGSDLHIEDGYTSTQHAVIAMDANGNCRLYDRGSTNGTFVEQARITDIVLAHGATIRIGSTELRFLAQ